MNFIIEKYKSMSKPLKASLWFMLCNVIQKGISVLCTPIFTRMMTADQYGEYTVYLSWYSIISIFASLNLAAGVYNNGLTKYPNDRDRISSSFLGLSSIATIVVFLVYIIFIDFWNSIIELPEIMIITMFVEVFFSSAFNLWSARLRYDYKYIGIIIACLIIGVFGPLTAYFAVLNSNNKSLAIVLSFAGVQIVVGIVLYISIFISGKTFYDGKYWKYALSFNLPLIPHYLSQILLNQADRIMIKRLIGFDAAAMYGVAYTISMVMLIVVSAINNTLVPYIYKSMKSNEIKKLKDTSTILTILVLIICIIATLCGPELIRLLAPEDYYQARWVVPPVATSLFFIFVAGLFGTIEFYYEKTKFVMIASSSAAISNVLLNYYYINLYGFIAAGYTTLICYILLMIAHFLFYRKLCKEHMNKIYDDKFIILLSLMIIIINAICLIIYDLILVRYVFFVLLVIVILFILKKVINVLHIIKTKDSDK